MWRRFDCLCLYVWVCARHYAYVWCFATAKLNRQLCAHVNTRTSYSAARNRPKKIVCCKHGHTAHREHWRFHIAEWIVDHNIHSSEFLRFSHFFVPTERIFLFLMNIFVWWPFWTTIYLRFICKSKPVIVPINLIIFVQIFFFLCVFVVVVFVDEKCSKISIFNDDVNCNCIRSSEKMRGATVCELCETLTDGEIK